MRGIIPGRVRRSKFAFFELNQTKGRIIQQDFSVGDEPKKFVTLLDLCVSSLRRGHANLLCIVPILTDDPRRESDRPGFNLHGNVGAEAICKSRPCVGEQFVS